MPSRSTKRGFGLKVDLDVARVELPQRANEKMQACTAMRVTSSAERPAIPCRHDEVIHGHTQRQELELDVVAGCQAKLLFQNATRPSRAAQASTRWRWKTERSQ